MNKQEFSKALELAKQGESASFDEMGALFDGFGFKEFQPVACTLKQLAALIVYQCFTFGGTIDTEALNEIWAAKRKFIVV
jgi:hypothetical protein